jgi:hypothetical protein
MKDITIGKVVIMFLVIMAMSMWVLSIERCGLTTLCNSHAAEMVGNMCALGSILIGIFINHYKK